MAKMINTEYDLKSIDNTSPTIFCRLLMKVMQFLTADKKQRPNTQPSKVTHWRR